jgi:hypothetical protein
MITVDSVWTSLRGSPDSDSEVHSRRLDDRIRQLCRKALMADDSELDPVFSELKAALREHTQRLRKLITVKLMRKTDDQTSDRRSA